MTKFLALVLALAPAAFAQPALPTPMHRQLTWVQPNPTNVAGFVLRWGTNRLDVSGVGSTSAVIRLEAGQQTIFLKAAAAQGTNDSDWTSNTVRLLRLTLEGSTNNATWQPETNWTWSISPSDPRKVYRTKLEWSQ